MSNPVQDTISAMPVPAADGAVDVQSRHWYVALVASRAEKSVRDKLLAMNVEAYVASRQEIHVWGRGQRRTVERVLITMTVFVHVTEDERRQLVNLPFIRMFMTDPAGTKNAHGRNPLAIIPDVEMQLLQAMLLQNDHDVAFATTNFAVGDQVRLLGFGDGNQIAQIIRLPNDKSTYVGVRVSFLGCAYMQVSPDSIIKVKQ